MCGAGADAAEEVKLDVVAVFSEDGVGQRLQSTANLTRTVVGCFGHRSLLLEKVGWMHQMHPHAALVGTPRYFNRPEKVGLTL